MEVDPSVAVSVRKLVMVSLMEIFKDITPSYRIRPLTAAEKAVKVPDPPPQTVQADFHFSGVLPVGTPKVFPVCLFAGEEGDAAPAGV